MKRTAVGLSSRNAHQVSISSRNAQQVSISLLVPNTCNKYKIYIYSDP